MAEQLLQNECVTERGLKNNETQFTGISRERSFIRTSNNNQNAAKRRSLALNQHIANNVHQQFSSQIRAKPALEIYRPPKLNYNLQHTSSSAIIYPAACNRVEHSKSTANVQQMALPNIAGHHRAILVSHPMHIGQLGVGVALQSSQYPMVNSPSSGNILHQSSYRVKFSQEPQTNKNSNLNNNQNSNTNNNNNNQNDQIFNNAIQMGLQRSKSLSSSADLLVKGSAGLGLALGNDATDIGNFSIEIQRNIDKALKDPNKLNARCLMELTNQIMQRAVEGRRYALPVSRLCIAIIAKEIKETFLEALLNTCRQWYQEREKILYPIRGMKSPSRTRFTAFMSFLTEMFCQLKRRQLQLHTQCDGAPPPLVLLTLLSKCCEDCVKPSVRSLSEIECLFFVLTCIGRDLENHLPQQLDILLASVRDAFLNSSASAPAIRRTLLQLIELHASQWQLPGNTVLYYYPASK